MNNNYNEEQSASQTQKILAWLMGGNTITQMAALRMFNCFRLASRISELKRLGVNITKVMVKNPCNGKYYAEYRIKQ